MTLTFEQTYTAQVNISELIDLYKDVAKYSSIEEMVDDYIAGQDDIEYSILREHRIEIINAVTKEIEREN